MRLLTLAAAAATISLAAACGDQPPQPRVSESGGAAGGASAPQPVGEREPLPPSPGGTAAQDTKPDPGDANDHSSPQHDAKAKSSGG